MNQVFVDTSYYLAAINPSDEGHEKAAEFASQYRGQSVTTEFVLLEVANSFCKAQFRSLFLALLADLKGDAKVTILAADAKLFSDGLEIYAGRPDKNWSLTDCISFAVMKETGIMAALTADHHFEQAGFKALMR